MKACPFCSSCFPDDVRFCPFHGRPLLDVTIWEPGSLVGASFDRHQLERLERGDILGEVYRARAGKQLGALRVFWPQVVLDKDRLEQALAAQKKLETVTHPGLVRASKAKEDEEGRIYATQEWVEGSSLRELLDEHGPLDAESAAALVRLLLGALIALHKLDLVHGYLSLDSIFVEQASNGNRTLRLADAGLGHLFVLENPEEIVSDHPEFFADRAHYMAPESISDGELSVLSDVYAIGVILYELLVGKPPFEQGSVATIFKRQLAEDPLPPPLAREDLEMPSALQDILNLALGKQPDQRFQKASAFLAALTAVAPPSELELEGFLPEQVFPAPELALGAVVAEEDQGSPAEDEEVQASEAAAPEAAETSQSQDEAAKSEEAQAEAVEEQAAEEEASAEVAQAEEAAAAPQAEAEEGAEDKAKEEEREAAVEVKAKHSDIHEAKTEPGPRSAEHERDQTEPAKDKGKSRKKGRKKGRSKRNSKASESAITTPSKGGEDTGKADKESPKAKADKESPKAKADKKSPKAKERADGSSVTSTEVELKKGNFEEEAADDSFVDLVLPDSEDGWFAASEGEDLPTMAMNHEAEEYARRNNRVTTFIVVFLVLVAAGAFVFWVMSSAEEEDPEAKAAEEEAAQREQELQRLEKAFDQALSAENIIGPGSAHSYLLELRAYLDDAGFATKQAAFVKAALQVVTQKEAQAQLPEQFFDAFWLVDQKVAKEAALLAFIQADYLRWRVQSPQPGPQGEAPSYRPSLATGLASLMARTQLDVSSFGVVPKLAGPKEARLAYDRWMEINRLWSRVAEFDREESAAHVDKAKVAAEQSEFFRVRLFAFGIDPDIEGPAEIPQSEQAANSQGERPTPAATSDIIEDQADLSSAPELTPSELSDALTESADGQDLDAPEADSAGLTDAQAETQEEDAADPSPSPDASPQDIPKADAAQADTAAKAETSEPKEVEPKETEPKESGPTEPKEVEPKEAAPDHSALLKEGLALMNSGKHDAAIEKLEASLAAKKSSQAYLALGEIYWEKRSFSEAASNYKKAISLSSRKAPILIKLGNCYFKMKDYEKALTSYEDAEQKATTAKNREAAQKGISLAKRKLGI